MFAAPDRFFTALARAELVTWTLLLAGMAGKYVFGLGQLGVTIGGGLHGFVFLAYCLVTVLVAVDQRWRFGSLAWGLGSAVLPYATLAFERYAARHQLLAETWRLRRERPRGPFETLAQVAVRRPVPSGVLLSLVIVGVFVGLVRLGPPTQWFS